MLFKKRYFRFDIGCSIVLSFFLMYIIFDFFIMNVMLFNKYFILYKIEIFT